MNPSFSTSTEDQDSIPTPISPIHNFESLLGQFSINDNSNHKQEQDTTVVTKSYACPDCNQVFEKAHNLKSHKATHSASKPFQCLECEKQFLRQHDLKRHQKLHTGERPYHCPVCKRSFSRSDALNRHRKTEGGSACYKSSPILVGKQQPSPLFIPNMTSQWQVLPSPSTILAKPSSPLLLPSIIINEENNTMDGMVVKNLKQRIHDLEIENRVLRSLLVKEEENQDDIKRRKRYSPS